MAPTSGSAGATATATVMDDPDKEKPQTFRSLPKLAEYCGVKDAEGFKAWLKGPLLADIPAALRRSNCTATAEG